MRQNTLPKAGRLKSRKKLQELFAGGKSVRAQDVRLIYLPENDSCTIKCGVGVSGRNFKKAVDRNRIKRLLRESYRKQQHEIKQFMLTSSAGVSLFLLYTGKEMPAYSRLHENVGVALQKLLPALDAMAVKNT